MQREVRGLGEEAEKWNYWLQLHEKKNAVLRAAAGGGGEISQRRA